MNRERWFGSGAGRSIEGGHFWICRLEGVGTFDNKNLRIYPFSYLILFYGLKEVFIVSIVGVRVNEM